MTFKSLRKRASDNNVANVRAISNAFFVDFCGDGTTIITIKRNEFNVGPKFVGLNNLHISIQFA
ncbi:hypothetical protein DERP_010844 [Dermatophagoides pteronyssinus]|uniref:Uncharacterized protein n=1 Tax=Dermatophagoides pteronyssinus TaxID=6956 RepID=A0ABQ8JUP3_DERPT|nr:hypothetical protein DERP_010844 [Dermatophagoides pteronyssinus]